MSAMCVIYLLFVRISIMLVLMLVVLSYQAA